MVHQHFQLVDVLTVTENVMLGDEAMRGPFLNDATRQRIVEIAKQYRLDVPPDALVDDLSVGAQQRVEIVKALYRDADILILDEPTAVLTPQEAAGLFKIMRTLIDGGRSIIFISHKLKEVLEICDDVVVLRRGKVVGEADPKTSTETSLAAMMVGRTVMLEVDEKRPATPNAAVLQFEEFTCAMTAIFSRSMASTHGTRRRNPRRRRRAGQRPNRTGGSHHRPAPEQIRTGTY